jgi:hypothetical protein
VQCACAILYFHLRRAPLCTIFSTLSRKRHDFRKKEVILHKMFLSPLQLLSETFLILRRNERDMIKMSSGLRVQYPLFLSNLNKTRNFSTVFFSKNTKISNFIKIRRVGAELFHADGRTDGGTDGRTDRHETADSRFSKICESAYKMFQQYNELINKLQNHTLFQHV